MRYFLIWTGFIGAAYAFITREHMCLVLVRDSLSPAGRRILMTFIDVLILLFAVFVITIGGFKLALSAQKVFSALLGIPRSLVYAMAPISGLFIILAQIINIYEDVTGITIEGIWHPAVPQLPNLRQYRNRIHRNCRLQPVLGPDYLYHHAEDEQRRGKLLPACHPSLYPGRQHHE